MYPRRINAKEVLIRTKDDEFIFSITDLQLYVLLLLFLCHSSHPMSHMHVALRPLSTVPKDVWKRLQIPSAHSEAGTTCKEGRSQRRYSRRIGRVSTGSSGRLLVFSRRLHLSSTHWTTRSFLFRRKNHSLFH